MTGQMFGKPSVLSWQADIVMTRYQAAQVTGRAYNGPVDCVRTMVKEVRNVCR
jgi:hypothetical protein